MNGIVQNTHQQVNETQSNTIKELHLYAAGEHAKLDQKVKHANLKVYEVEQGIFELKTHVNRNFCRRILKLIV